MYEDQLDISDSSDYSKEEAASRFIGFCVLVEMFLINCWYAKVYEPTRDVQR